MKFLKMLFSLILVLMVVVTTWASIEKNLLAGFAAVFQERWAVATLADAYCGFLTFYAWVFYKESNWFARVSWFVAIMIFGNIAMASYVLVTLFRLGSKATPETLLLRRSV